MKIRVASVGDAKEIHSLISEFAGLDRMLFRSLSNIYESLQSFFVAQDEQGRVVGCVSLSIMWEDLAEIKSLAVAKELAGKGIGRALVSRAIERAKGLGIERIFALTLEPVFFERLGFARIDKGLLPMKVWSDCADCPKQDQCDEIAVIINSKDAEIKV